MRFKKNKIYGNYSGNSCVLSSSDTCLMNVKTQNLNIGLMHLKKNNKAGCLIESIKQCNNVFK